MLTKVNVYSISITRFRCWNFTSLLSRALPVRFGFRFGAKNAYRVIHLGCVGSRDVAVGTALCATEHRPLLSFMACRHRRVNKHPATSPPGDRHQMLYNRIARRCRRGGGDVAAILEIMNAAPS